MAKGKKIEIQHNGRTFWYYQEQERAVVEFMKLKKKIAERPMITAVKEWIEKNKDDDLYDAKLIAELVNYPESVREEFGVSSARHGSVEKKVSPDGAEVHRKYLELGGHGIFLGHEGQKAHDKEAEVHRKLELWKNNYSLIEEMKPIQEKLNDTHFKLQQHLAKYPVTPEQAFNPRHEQIKTKGGSPLGKPVLFGTGGEINSYDNFQDLFNQHVWPKYDRNQRFSVRFGLIDMSEGGKFEEYIGTYPRKMLLLI